MHVQAYSSPIVSEQSVQTLAFNPNKKSHLNQTLLHIAAQDGRNDRIHLLLNAGAEINAVDDSQRTPLALAVIKGHIDTVQLLINQRASIHDKDINHETPLDIAIRYGHEDIAHLLLGTQKRLDKSKIQKSNDLDKYYENCLMKAKKEGLVEEQIYYLILLSESYLKKNNFAISACIINSAIAVLQNEKGPVHIQDYLLARLDRIELFLLESRGVRAFPRPNKILKYRDYLTLLRNTCEAGFKKGEASKVIVNSLTVGFKKLMQTFLLEAMDKVGRPPVKKWACIGMGSYARREICPYSDVEFAFLIDQQTPEALRYFRTVSKLLQLMIINLGETKFPIFGKDEPSPTTDGFCMDSGGNTPLGGVFELIGTPQHLSQLQTSEWINSNIILTNVMSCVSLIDGDESLLTVYQNEVSQKQRIKEDGNQPNYQLLALQLLKGHLDEFAPNLTEEKEKLKAFGIKKELYRPIQEIINCLCLYYQIKAGNTFDRIDELVKIKVLSPQGADNLKKALSKAIALRLEAHFFYKDENEIISHADDDNKILYIDQQKQQALDEIYKVLQPLHWMAEEFYKTQDKTRISSSNFSSAGLYFSGAILELIEHYPLANDFFQKAVALNPSVDSLMKMASTEQQLGKHDKALQHYQEALQMALSTYGEYHLKVAKCYCNIGMLLAAQVDDLGEVLKYYKKALTIFLADNTSEGQRDAGCVYLIMGTTLVAMKQPNKARVCAEKAAVIYEGLLNTEYADPANFNLIANLYVDLNDFQMALKYYQQSLNLCKGDLVICKGDAHYHLGECYNKMEDFDQAILHLKRSIAFYSKNSTGYNKEIAQSYTFLGQLFSKQKNYQNALACHHQSLKKLRFVYGDEHDKVAEELVHMGDALNSLGNYTQASKLYTKAIKIFKKNDIHPLNLAIYYGFLAHCYLHQQEYEIFVKIYTKIAALREKGLKKDDPILADTYYNTGIGFMYLGNKKETVAWLNKALSIYKKIYQPNHSKISLCKYQILHTQTTMKERKS